ncbi:lipid-A-disaccharide synthase N-terminal domain-containing protein [Dyella solisilvae]|uniref:lipid-A-disaccharide synthase N-terminal domain-containing protein n=1 Tax=Dyella solisilvae TaxID=1920168 RepID=UPI0018F5C256|nr:lipid-A-disaccharide synthase N-terminal domain-containing protein [Dyella solisilvae]
MSSTNTIWMIIGMTGQAIFSARFVLQWIYSEYRRESAIPMSFWYASIVGGATLFAYAIYRRDPVFLVGQAFGLFVYLRNIELRFRESRQAMESRSR